MHRETTTRGIEVGRKLEMFRSVVIPPTTVGRRHYKMIGGVCLSVRPVCGVPRPNSRTERPTNPKLAGWKPRVTVNLHFLEFKRSKGQGHQAD